MPVMEREECMLGDGTISYKIGDEHVEADRNNVSVGIRPGAADDGTYPDCPDCGGRGGVERGRTRAGFARM